VEEKWSHQERVTSGSGAKLFRAFTSDFLNSFRRKAAGSMRTGHHA
jgi:hypothetical protein